MAVDSPKTTDHLQMTGKLPLVEELSPAPAVAEILPAFADLDGVLLLDSSLVRGELGRYSFLTAEPFDWFTLPPAELLQRPDHRALPEGRSGGARSEHPGRSIGVNPFAALRRRLEEFPTEAAEGLPPFQGGAAGMLSYELGGRLERLPRARHDEFELPALAVGLYDWTIAWDHAAGRAWIISQGFPETAPARRTDRAAERLRFVRQRVEVSKSRRVKEHATTEPHRDSATFRFFDSGTAGDNSPLTAPRFPATQYPAPGPSGLTSDFSRDGYLRAVERVIEYIRAGDIFQANLSQRLLYPLREHPVELFCRLRDRNPAPMAGYFASGDWAVASASPERFVRVVAGEVETRPIKGTRHRRVGPEADLFTRDELRESVKDQAENVMIVDLLRNDLSRVCRPGSIAVPHVCRVETYQTVQHLVSEVRGRLSPGCDAWDLLAAVFPGGSITGAPKIRAMEIIAELEPTVRGPYCGSLFYVGFDGNMDSSILIRTFICRRGRIQCPVGGGIVARSDPQAEYEETLHKAEGMLRALS